MKNQNIRVMNFGQWPLWKRALAVNVSGIFGIGVWFGIGIGFAKIEVKLTHSYYVPIAVFALTVLNFFFLIVRPQVLSASQAGTANVTGWRVFVETLRQRPLVLALVVLQLCGVSRLVAMSVTLFAIGGFLGLPNLQTGDVRWMVFSACVMAVVASIWLTGAIGLCANQRWGWWLALVLNGLFLAVAGALQVVHLQRNLLDALTIAGFVLLWLPAVRNELRSTGEKHVSANW